MGKCRDPKKGKAGKDKDARGREAFFAGQLGKKETVSWPLLLRFFEGCLKGRHHGKWPSDSFFFAKILTLPSQLIDQIFL